VNESPEDCFDVPDPFDQDGPGLFDDVASASGAPVDPATPSIADSPVTASQPPATVAEPPVPSDDVLVAPPAAGEIERPEAPLALYRRYRPETFAEVIGQEHVTEPLQRALLNNKVNHAYLFSGPRGCGKTTSARILARALNCAEGPTAVPCGVCDSCIGLGRGGGGTIDVIEIDAASHGGVNEARDLRERAFFSPVASRYKIYIIDEAHMVTKEGFNALLKVVEEPPPHVKFIFATTEPDKVLGTIRSRTHHYPFRLVPPKVLGAYLADVCESEDVPVDPAVLPLVVRAGGGSVRDSLSVLDQLLGGASDEGVTYSQATGLLGFTPDSLLDETVDAISAGDAASVFAAVEKVMDVGQDPRRFAEDLLRRLRDLLIVAAVPEALTNGLIAVSSDQAERLTTQAAGLGSGELTRAAEVIATGLTEMRGTTAPRLHLELMLARVLLPGADVDGRGVHARLDRIERRLAMPAQGSPAEDSSDVAPVTELPTGGHADASSARGSWGADDGGSGARPSGSASLPDGARAGHPSTRPRAVPPLSSSGRDAEPGDGSAYRQEADESATRGSGAQGRRERSARDAGESRDDNVVPLERRRESATPANEGRMPADRPDQDAGAERPASDRSDSARADSGRPQAGASVPDRASRGNASDRDAANRPVTERSGGTAAGERRPSPERPAAASPANGPGRSAAGQVSVSELRNRWPEVLAEVKRRRRFTWILLSQNAQVAEVADGVLTLEIGNLGARESFGRGGSDQVLRDALVEVLGLDLKIAVGGATVAASAATPPQPAEQPPAKRSAAAAAAREAMTRARATPATPESPVDGPEEELDPDDLDADMAMSSDELLASQLGAELIGEEEPE
jgi:DNA polymerase-3 subunit gamma/tau